MVVRNVFYFFFKKASDVRYGFSWHAIVLIHVTMMMTNLVIILTPRRSFGTHFDDVPAVVDVDLILNDVRSAIIVRFLITFLLRQSAPICTVHRYNVNGDLRHIYFYLHGSCRLEHRDTTGRDYTRIVPKNIMLIKI